MATAKSAQSFKPMVVGSSSSQVYSSQTQRARFRPIPNISTMAVANNPQRYQALRFPLASRPASTGIVGQPIQYGSTNPYSLLGNNSVSTGASPESSLWQNLATGLLGPGMGGMGMGGMGASPMMMGSPYNMNGMTGTGMNPLVTSMMGGLTAPGLIGNTSPYAYNAYNSYNNYTSAISPGNFAAQSLQFQQQQYRQMYTPAAFNNYNNFNNGRPYSPMVYTGRPPAFAIQQMSVSARQLEGHRCSPRDTNPAVCMACNIYFESGNQSQEGMRAVGGTVMTRVRSNGYPNTVCGVVYQGHNRPNGLGAQYSWTNDGRAHILPRGPVMERILQASEQSLVQGPTGYTNYYAYRQIAQPYWARPGTECSRTLTDPLGAHQFCAVRASLNRTSADWLMAEGIRDVRQIASTESASSGAR